MPTVRQVPSKGWRGQESTVEERQQFRGDVLFRPGSAKCARSSLTRNRSAVVETFGTELRDLYLKKPSMTESMVSDDSVIGGDLKGFGFLDSPKI